MGKKGGLIVTLLMMIMTALGQTEKDEEIRPARKLDRFILEFTTDRWLETPEGIELRPYSPGFSVFYMYDYPVARENLSLAWGYGLSSINVHHNGTFARRNDNEYVELIPLDEEVDYRKNKSTATYVDLAAEVRIRTNGERRLKLILGARGGFLVNFHHKFKDDDETIKRKDRDHILPYHYGLTARIAIGRVGITTFYSLSEMFKEGDNTELVPISGGLFFTF
jgi:hypothetical protein